jgi:hypothetical protein
MAPAVEPLKKFADTITVEDPKHKILSNRDGSVVASGQEFLDSLVKQVTNPVRWDLCMAQMLQDEVTDIIEVTPAGTLVGLAKRAMRGVPFTAVNAPEDLEKFGV